MENLFVIVALFIYGFLYMTTMTADRYNSTSSVLIGSGANVDIRAVDSIEVGSGLSVSSNGALTLRCDKQVSISGSAVNNGGTLAVKGEKVVFSNGFSVKAGGSLTVNDI